MITDENAMPKAKYDWDKVKKDLEQFTADMPKVVGDLDITNPENIGIFRNVEKDASLVLTAEKHRDNGVSTWVLKAFPFSEHAKKAMEAMGEEKS